MWIQVEVDRQIGEAYQWRGNLLQFLSFGQSQFDLRARLPCSRDKEEQTHKLLLNYIKFYVYI